MGSSGGGMSAEESYNMQKQARIQAEQEIAQAEAKKKADAQAAASGAKVTTTGGEGSEETSGALSEAKKRKNGTLAGQGEQVFSAKNLGD